MPLFSRLALYVDSELRDGPGQMALDEALWERADVPVLRVYRWNGPWVSFGYRQSLGAVRQVFPQIPLVRRWTGGGMVEHQNDWTFSLVVPVGEALVGVRPAESYRLIHGAVRQTLGGDAILGEGGDLVGSVGPEACFVRPVRDDVLDARGRKLCGGAQRRTRSGFLHQGSLQGVQVPEDFGQRLAATLAGERVRFQAGPDLLRRATELDEGKYGTRDWLEKVV